jgi:hypothetical protein
MAMHGELTGLPYMQGANTMVGDSHDPLSALNDLVRQMQYGSLAKENLRLAHENRLLRAMEENRRLLQENMILRMQQNRIPPGLSSHGSVQCQVPQWKGRHGVQLDSMTAVSMPAALLTRQNSVSTTAGPSQNASTESSRAPSDDGQEGSTDANQTLNTPSRGRTSVMMRNLPNNFNRKMLLDLLTAEGYQGKFDFAYLPIDFQSGSGLGYAFVNLVTPEIAEDFTERFSGFDCWSMVSEKTCHVTWSDSLQGLSSHVERYRNSPVMHESVPDDHKPLLFHGVQRVPFPAPTKRIRAPRRWHRRK